MSSISGDEESLSSGEAQQNKEKKHRLLASTSKHQEQSGKKKRNLPGNPDPTAEVVALSPKTLMATNRFVCEICNKGFQRDQNLQLHRRGHNLPWKLRQRTSSELANKKRVYICPEPTCLHHNPSRALGDLTGIKKHYSRKHGEKKWKCDKCSKKYAVQSDWKAHLKTCGSREYKCDCGTIFSRRDSFITHRAFCDALNEENNKVNETLMAPQDGANLQAQLSTMQPNTSNISSIGPNFNNPLKALPQDFIPIPFNSHNMFSTTSGPLLSPRNITPLSGLQLGSNIPTPSSFHYHQDHTKIVRNTGKAQMSATALLQKAAQMSSTTTSNTINSSLMQKSFVSTMAGHNQISGLPGSKPNSNLQAYDNFQAQVDQRTPPNTGGYVNDVVMYSGMLMSGRDRQTSAVGFLNNRVVDVHNHDFVDQSSDNSNAAARGFTTYGGERDNSDHMTTVDFLGVGGSQPQIHHDQGVNLFNQQIYIHGDSEVAKRLYNAFR